MAGRRRLVPGLFKRKGSDIYQGRFRIPSDLWRDRARLAALGISDLPKAQEHGRSTGTVDRDEAGNAYRSMLVAWDAKLDGWRKLLADGPQALTERQQKAIAADHARAFIAANADNPSSAPPPVRIGELPQEGEEAWAVLVRQMPPAERKTLAADFMAYQSADEERRRPLALSLLQKYPGLAGSIGSGLAAALEAMHGEDTNAALAARGLHVDAESRRLVNFEMARFMGVAERGLEAMRDGDYSPPRELEVAPAFVPTAKADKLDPKFTFKGIVDAEKARRALGKDAKPFPDSTPRKYAKRGEEFAAWRKSQGLGKAAASDARTVTREEAERWRSSLIAGGEFTNRTINDKVSCIST